MSKGLKRQAVPTARDAARPRPRARAAIAADIRVDLPGISEEALGALVDLERAGLAGKG